MYNYREKIMIGTMKVKTGSWGSEVVVPRIDSFRESLKGMQGQDVVAIGVTGANDMIRFFAE